MHAHACAACCQDSQAAYTAAHVWHADSSLSVYDTGDRGFRNAGIDMASDCHSKRRRDASGAPVATRRKPLKSTEEVLASVGLTQDVVDSCSLRCGSGGLIPMRQGVRRMLVDTVQRFSGILSVDCMRQCMEKVIQTQDRMLAGLSAGAYTGFF